MKAYRHLELGDMVVCKSARGPNGFASVVHLSSGGDVFVKRWQHKQGRWTKMERLPAEAYMRTVTKEEFYKETSG